MIREYDVFLNISYNLVLEVMLSTGNLKVHKPTTSVFQTGRTVEQHKFLCTITTSGGEERED